MISDRTKAYYDLKKRNDVRESAKRLRRQFLRYKDAEIVIALRTRNCWNSLVKQEPYIEWMEPF